MAATANNCPSISLVIPVRDEEASIDRLLASIAAQTRQPHEVVFVDGGSRDNTVSLIRSTTRTNSSYRVVEAGPASPGKGRNIGIAEAQNDCIALTDAGIRLEPTWLDELAKVLTDGHYEIVYGSYEPTADSFIERCGALLYTHKKEHRGGGLMRGPFIASSLLRRDVWKSVGGFPDQRAAEDLMFMEEVERAGHRIGWAPGAVVWWQPQPTVAGTFRRFVTFSRVNVLAGRQRYWHHAIARAYAVSIVFLFLALFHHPGWLVVPALILLARAARSIWRRRDGRSIFWAASPIQFAGVTLLLLVIDAASFVGWAQAIAQRFLESSAAGRHAKNGSV